METPTAPGIAPVHRTDAHPRILVATLALLLVLFGRGLVQGATQGPDGIVTQIKVEGNASISEDEIKSKISTRVGRPYNERVLNDDVSKLMGTNWFGDVRTYYKKDPKQPNGLILTFQVVELPILRDVQYIGLSKIKRKEIEENTGIKTGARADFIKTQMAVRQIKQLYGDKGYEWAEVRLLEGGKPGDTRAIFEIFEGPKCQLREIRFTGNTYVSDGVLRTKISSRTAILGLIGGKYHRDEIEEDARKLREYYESQGFFQVKVRPVVRPDANMGDLRVEFVVWEGVQFKIRNIRFEGNKLIPTEKLREGLVMHSNKPFSNDLRDADRKAIEAKYGAIGCIDAQVITEKEYADQEKHPGIVDLVYRIDEGVPYRLGRLIVKGNARTMDAVIRREANMAGLVPGEPIDLQRMEKFKQRLGNLRYFASDPNQGKPIDIKLTNRRPANQPYGDGSVAGFGEFTQTRLQNPSEEDGFLPQASPAPSTVGDSEDPFASIPVEEPLAPGPGPAGVAPLNAAPAASGATLPSPLGGDNLFAPPVDAPLPAIEAPPPSMIEAPPPGLVPGSPPPATRTPPYGNDVPPGMFPSLPGSNMTDVGPDRQEPFNNRSFADIVTQVDEVATGRLMFGVGASSFGGLNGNLIIHETNFDLFNFPRSFGDITGGRAFRGRGQDLRIELSPGTLINRAVVSFRDPYVFNLPIGFGASGYTFQRYYPDWTEGRGGGRFSLGRQFGVRTYADVAFRIEDVNIYGYRTPAPAELLAVSGHSTLATIRPSLRFDNRNDPFAPNKGQYFEAAFEQGWGTFTFPKITLEGRQYYTLGSRPDGSGKRILTFRGFFGVTGRDTPIYERFFAGDFRSMRGFSYRGVGPRVLGVNVGGVMTAIGSVEYQFPWTANDKLQQVVFCDFGTVEDSYNFTNFRAAVGTGLRVYLPQQMFGPLPLAFDIAFPVAKAYGDHTRVFTFFIGAFW